MGCSTRSASFCPESGKKADLMFVQHMLSVLRPGGMVVTVMPHGVLFRGGTDRGAPKCPHHFPDCPKMARTGSGTAPPTVRQEMRHKSGARWRAGCARGEQTCVFLAGRKPL
jgi:N-6 DNA Methylase